MSGIMQFEFRLFGPRKGQTLELLPLTLTTWASWRTEHPDGLSLDAPGGRSGFDLARMAIVVDNCFPGPPINNCLIAFQAGAFFTFICSDCQ